MECNLEGLHLWDNAVLKQAGGVVRVSRGFHFSQDLEDSN